MRPETVHRLAGAGYAIIGHDRRSNRPRRVALAGSWQRIPSRFTRLVSCRIHDEFRACCRAGARGYDEGNEICNLRRSGGATGGRWKLIILFHLFGDNVMRFSDLERAIPAVSQKMLIQQLRQMESDGIVRRIVHHQVPPKVEYCLTEWGQALCPALDALLSWAAQRKEEGAD